MDWIGEHKTHHSVALDTRHLIESTRLITLLHTAGHLIELKLTVGIEWYLGLYILLSI